MANDAQTQKVWRLRARGDPASLTLGTEPVPRARAHEVVVRIRAVALNYRDYLITHGLYPFPVKDDVVPMSDIAGEVAAVGEGVTGFKIGDRVTANFDQTNLYGPQQRWTDSLGGALDGALQEYRAFPQTVLLALPAHLPWAEAATLPIAGVTAWNALFGGIPLVPGQTVLLQGTGGVSIAGLVLAHAAGARTIITSSSDAKLERAKALGASLTINYKTFPNWEEKVMELTDGVGAHSIFDNAGVAEIEKTLNCVARGGIVSCIGFLAAGDAPPPNVPLIVLDKNATLRGIQCGPKQMFDDLLRFVAVKRLHFVVDRVFPFAEAPAAIAYLKSGAHFGKVVVRVA